MTRAWKLIVGAMAAAVMLPMTGCLAREWPTSGIGNNIDDRRDALDADARAWRQTFGDGVALAGLERLVAKRGGTCGEAPRAVSSPNAGLFCEFTVPGRFPALFPVRWGYLLVRKPSGTYVVQQRYRWPEAL